MSTLYFIFGILQAVSGFAVVGNPKVFISRAVALKKKWKHNY